jgi:ferredoxin
MAFIDNTCIGCDVCTTLCPEVFVLGKDGMAESIAKRLPSARVDDCHTATEECPTSSILILEGSSI